MLCNWLLVDNPERTVKKPCILKKLMFGGYYYREESIQSSTAVWLAIKNYELFFMRFQQDNLTNPTTLPIFTQKGNFPIVHHIHAI